MAVINKFLVPVSEEKVRLFKVLTADSSEIVPTGISDNVTADLAEPVDVN